MPIRKFVTDSPDAPKAIGPYSQAVITDSMVFLSGQVPLDPQTGMLVAGDIEAQVDQVMKNIRAVLTHCDLAFESIVKTTIFLTDLKNFQIVNKTYERWLGAHKPARSTVQVSGLPAAAMVEIEVIALRA